jgi:hypothetical protein
MKEATMLPIEEKYAKQTEFTLRRYSIERAVIHLDLIEACAFIRAAYDCTFPESLVVLDAIRQAQGVTPLQHPPVGLGPDDKLILYSTFAIGANFSKQTGK